MATTAFARKKARKILKEFGVTAPPVAVRDIIEGHGLRIEEVEREDAYNGELIPEHRCIRLNTQKPKTRQRFTLAHELGHWVLYHRQRMIEDENLPLEADAETLDETDFDDQATQKARDDEADTFAAELLMPTQWVRVDWKSRRPDVRLLAERYEVSEEAMWYQVMGLGLIK